MPAPIECEGAPRDLGRDQAAAAPGAVRGAAGMGGPLRRPLRRMLARLAPVEPGLLRWRRDLRRYFPHQHEWLEGAARAAGVPDRALLRAACAAFDRERDAWLVAHEGEAGPRLWRAPAPGALLRRMRPEGRFVSIELASPLLPCPWIGVNEAGLAVALSGGRLPGRCAAHAALLGRDCLERFESVESALAWCLGRPAAAGAAILLADAGGELAGVVLSPAGREVRRPGGGVLALGGARAAEIGKEISAGRPPADAFQVDVAARCLRRAADAEAHSAKGQPLRVREGLAGC